MIDAIRDSAARRGITRLCHFTPSRNLAHIATGLSGILASKSLAEAEKAIFNPTDSHRWDSYTDHVCCSIQYPNAWYFRTARTKERLFPDWVVLLIKAHYLWRAGTKFCPRNAAAGHGRTAAEGAAAFEALFAETVEGPRAFSRGPRHPAFLPTDEQAEVLIPDCIQRQDVLGIAVGDDAQAKREASRLDTLEGNAPPIAIVPEFFDPHALSRLLRGGKMPQERAHRQGGAHAR